MHKLRPVALQHDVRQLQALPDATCSHPEGSGHPYGTLPAVDQTQQPREQRREGGGQGQRAHDDQAP
eukprot:15448518-Alexandrium_andersonii.AAC.1